MAWDDELSNLRMKDTPMVYLSGLLSELDFSDEDLISLAECALTGGDYELEFLYSFTAHLMDLMADIEEIGKTASQPIEYTVSEILERTLQSMGVEGI